MDPSMFGSFDALVMQALGGAGGAGMPGPPRSLLPQNPAAGMDFGKILGGLGPLAGAMLKNGQPGQPQMPQFQNMGGGAGNLGQVPMTPPAGPLAMANAIRQRSPY